MGNATVGMKKSLGMLPAAQCVKGRDVPLPNVPAQNATHFIKGTSLYGPWDPKYKTVMIGMGCFWCSENLFMKMDGVYSTTVGYAGGETQNPSYEDVCSGRTNHNEVCRIVYDPSILQFRDIMQVFWTRHDPTTHCQQGGDRGTQYRSGIYYYDVEQKQVSEETRDRFQATIDKEFGAGSKQISTEIIPAPKDYWMAEEHHQQYDAKPGSRQYCGLKPLRLSAVPKL